MSDERSDCGMSLRYSRHVYRAYSFVEGCFIPCTDPCETVQLAVQLGNEVANGWRLAGDPGVFEVRPCLVLLH